MVPAADGDEAKPSDPARDSSYTLENRYSAHKYLGNNVSVESQPPRSAVTTATWCHNAVLLASIYHGVGTHDVTNSTRKRHEHNPLTIRVLVAP